MGLTSPGRVRILSRLHQRHAAAFSHVPGTKIIFRPDLWFGEQNGMGCSIRRRRRDHVPPRVLIPQYQCAACGRHVPGSKVSRRLPVIEVMLTKRLSAAALILVSSVGVALLS